MYKIQIFYQTTDLKNIIKSNNKQLLFIMK